MTAYGLIASLAWTASAVLFVARSDRFLNRWLDARQTQTTDRSPIAIPDDLIGFAMAETEKWAQDSVLKVIRERYDEFKDWNKVRAAIGVAQVHQA